MARMDLGTDGEQLLVDKYRELYWQKNEYQIIGTIEAAQCVAAIDATMTRIVSIIGYTPSA